MPGSREAPCELSGMAVALHAVHVELGDSPAGAAARRALGRVRSRFDVQRWGVTFELPGGDAGIALGALEADDPGLAGRTILLRGPGALESSWCTPTGPAPSPPLPQSTTCGRTRETGCWSPSDVAGACDTWKSLGCTAIGQPRGRHQGAGAWGRDRQDPPGPVGIGTFNASRPVSPVHVRMLLARMPAMRT